MSEVVTASGVYAVDRSMCIASGDCVVHLPGMFRQDASGLAELVRGPQGEDEVRRVHEAFEDCPSGAISFTRHADG